MKKTLLILIVAMSLICWIVSVLRSDCLKKMHICFIKEQDENACMLLDNNMNHSTIFSHDWEHRYGNLEKTKCKLSALENEYKSAGENEKEVNELFFHVLELEKNINDMIYSNCNIEDIIKRMDEAVYLYISILKKSKISHAPSRVKWLIKRRNFLSVISGNNTIGKFDNIIYSTSTYQFYFIPKLESDCKLKVVDLIEKKTIETSNWTDIKDSFFNLCKKKSTLYCFRIKNAYKCVNKQDIKELLNYIKEQPDDNDALFTIAYYLFWERQAMGINQNYTKWKASMKIFIYLAHQGHKDSINFLNLILNKKNFEQIMEAYSNIEIDSIIMNELAEA